MGRPRGRPPKQKPGVPVQWRAREGWRAFGDRLDFLSPEAQHLQTGRLRILPRAGEKNDRVR